MTPERWQQIKDLLDACDELDAAERPAWLAKACGDDTALLHEVSAYLAHEDELDAMEGFSPAGSLLEVLEGNGDESGQLIDRYRIESLLGRGGMGTVYRARREADFEQRVALKLMPVGSESPEALRRFHKERQILARLEHPNIARLLDGGTSADNRPYFVMELIDGLPIDRYCDEHRLSTRERVELFLQVCDALRFAHGNLVLHRDLKPSNIMVTREGVPKLLDFGIAKLLESRPGDTAGSTGIGRPMTVRYASPEQLLEEPITTASDIYSLGVVLYEILTGRLPYGLGVASPALVARAVCEDEPHEPSAAVLSQVVTATGDETLFAPELAAEMRDGSVGTLHRSLRGDIDAILQKALQKKAGGRYESVEQLASDLRRHLDSRTVSVRPATVAYRSGKYVRRHRWGLTGITTVLALILAFTFTLARQLESTRRERDRSERLSGFLVNLFRAAEPDRVGTPPTVEELVDIGRRRLDQELGDEPEMRASLLGTLGEVYHRLGHFAAAREALEASMAALHDRYGGDHPTIARGLSNLSVVAFEHGEYALAEELARESIAMRLRLGREDELTKPRGTLAAVLLVRGKLVEAEALYRRSLEERRAELGERHPNVARSLTQVALTLYRRGDFDAAEPLFRQALDIRLEHYDRDTPTVASVLAHLGRVAHARGDLDAAETLYHEALDIRRRRLGPDHWRVAILEKDLAELLLERGELETARVLLEHAFVPIYRTKREGDWTRADLESVYGSYLAAQGRFDAAEVCLRKAYRELERAQGPDTLPVRRARQRFEGLEAIRESPQL